MSLHIDFIYTNIEYSHRVIIQSKIIVITYAVEGDRRLRDPDRWTVNDAYTIKQAANTHTHTHTDTRATTHAHTRTHTLYSVIRT